MEAAGTAMTSRRMSEAPGSGGRSEFQELTSYLGHEVRGPLTVILGNALLLQRLESCDEDLRNGLRDIQEQAEKLSRIMDGLLLLAAARVEPEPLSTGIVVSKVVELFRRQHPTRPLQLVLNMESMTLGVQSYVEEILENLLSNADKYSPQGENIAVEVNHTRCAVTISVADKGSGIVSADQERVFNLFIRLGQTEAIPGHGIGLALCRRLASVMDGELTYEDRPGGGSRFVLTLPRQVAPPAIHVDEWPFSPPIRPVYRSKQRPLSRVRAKRHSPPARETDRPTRVSFHAKGGIWEGALLG